MLKYFLSIFILLSFTSCGKKAKLKFIPPNNFERNEKVLSDKTEVNGREILEKNPLLDLHIKKATLNISEKNQKFYHKEALKIKRVPYLRNKLVSLLENPYHEQLTIDDLFKYEFKAEVSSIFKSLSNTDLLKINQKEASLSLGTYLKASVEGIFDEVSYSVKLGDSKDHFVERQLENLEEQVEGFEFGRKPRESYVVNSKKINFESLVKSLSKRESVIVSIENFTKKEMSLSKWKDQILNSGSILVISNSNDIELVFISDGQSVEESLVENNVDLKRLREFSPIQFESFKDRIEKGRVLGIINSRLDNNDPSYTYKKIQNIKTIKFTKNSDKPAYLFIQLKTIKHSIVDWLEPQRVTIHKDGIPIPSSRMCNVRRRKVEQVVIPTRFSGIQHTLYSLSYNGEKHNFVDLIKNKNISIVSNKNAQYFEILNLPGESDVKEVTLSIRSEMKNDWLIQDKGECKLFYYERVSHYDGEVEIEEERFDNFSPSRIKVQTGSERFINAILIN